MITQWKNGTRPLSPEDAALLADLAHADARQAVIDAVVERNAGTEKGDRLREVLGKVPAVFGVGMLVFSFSGQVKDVTASELLPNQVTDTSHIVFLSRMRFLVLRILSVFRARGLRAWAPAPRPWTNSHQAHPVQRLCHHQPQIRYLVALA